MTESQATRDTSWDTLRNGGVSEERIEAMKATAARIAAAALLLEYRDCHALTTSHPAATGFRDAWSEMTDAERMTLTSGSLEFPRFDAEHSGPRCRNHGGDCARCRTSTVGALTRTTAIGEVHLSCVTREIPAR